VTTLDDTVAVFRRWLYLPDPTALYAVLGTVAANRLPGDPVWLVLVGSPGGGKTELLQAVAALPDVHPAATLTEAALLSGTPKKERDGAANGGLLRTIGDFGILLAKDFGSVLSMPREARAATLAALREIYDGEWTRHLGTDGGKTLRWEGKVGLIAGCTPTIDRHQAVMGAMGERFVLFRLPPVDAHEQAGRALEHSGSETEMRAELAAAVTMLFARNAAQPQSRSQHDDHRLINLATLVVRCRSAVERDGYSREIELIPESEAPTRLVIVLARLLNGLRVIGADENSAWRVIRAAALDSIPAVRRLVMDRLLAAEGALALATIAEMVGHPKRTTERALEDLAAHRVVTKISRGAGTATAWELAGWAVRSYTAATSPEMSGQLYRCSSKELTDKSGEVYISSSDGAERNVLPLVLADSHGLVAAVDAGGTIGVDNDDNHLQSLIDAERAEV
jgi:hypothetical protein